MKKRIVLLTALLAGVFALPAFAEQLVGRVQVDISPNEDTELEPGATYSKPGAVAMDSGYTVSDYSVDGKYNTPKKPYTYSITVRADEGQFFDSSTVVEVRGAYEMAVTEKGKNTIRIKANAYPYYVLQEPKNFRSDENSYSWDKVNYATGYDILVFYNTKNGDDKIAKKHSNTPRFNFSSFNRSGKEFDHIAVRAVYDKKDDMAQYFSDSLYVDTSGSVEDPDGDSGEYYFNLITLKATGLSKGSFKEYSAKKKKKSKQERKDDGKKRASEKYNGNQNKDNPDANGPGEVVAGWRQNGSDWYFENDGKLAKGWALIKDHWFYFDDGGRMLTNWQKVGEDWYYMNSDGVMLSGWQLVNGKWYYFGTEGAAGKMANGWRQLNGQWYFLDQTNGDMKIGWQNIDGKWYFFNLEDAGFPQGAMEKNTVKDGYVIDANGVRQ